MKSRNQMKKSKTFEKIDTNLLGHPVINRNLGIDFSNGSLGMGLSLGIGVAISAKKKKLTLLELPLNNLCMKCYRLIG